MGQPAKTSPFAAKTSREQKEQWIIWQTQHQEEKDGIQSVFDDTDMNVSKTDQSPHSIRLPAPHHGQYNAVVRRLTQASRQTISFVDTAASPPVTDDNEETR